MEKPKCDTNVLLVLDNDDPVAWGAFMSAHTEEDFLRAAKRSALNMWHMIEDVRRWIRWTALRPEIDPMHIGIIGFSAGAIHAAVIMGTESLVSAGIFMMGGGNVHEVLAYANYDEARAIQKRAKERFGWSRENLPKS